MALTPFFWLVTTPPETTESEAVGCPGKSFPRSLKIGDGKPHLPTAHRKPAMPSDPRSAGSRILLASGVETNTPCKPPRSKSGAPTPADLADNLPPPETQQVVVTWSSRVMALKRASNDAVVSITLSKIPYGPFSEVPASRLTFQMGPSLSSH